MSYRSDHDAALARIDALEQDNARLATENAVLKTAPRDARVRAVAGLLGLGVALVTGTLLLASKKDDAEPPPRQVEKNAIFAKVDLPNPVEACARRLAAKLKREDVERDGLLALSSSPVSLASCRDVVYTRLTRKIISVDERRVLQWWLQAEDGLDEEVDLLKKYYSTDATTRGQDGAVLWRGYDDAYDDRRAAIAVWHRGSAR